MPRYAVAPNLYRWKTAKSFFHGWKGEGTNEFSVTSHRPASFQRTDRFSRCDMEMGRWIQEGKDEGLPVIAPVCEIDLEERDRERVREREGERRREKEDMSDETCSHTQ